MIEIVAASVLKLTQRLVKWVAEHLGWAIWIILVVGIGMVFWGAVLSEHLEWRSTPTHSSDSIQDMFSKKPIGSSLERITDRTIEAVGIEIIGAAIVAIAFLLTRDSNSEKLDALAKRIEQLQDTQAQIVSLVTLRKERKGP